MKRTKKTLFRKVPAVILVLIFVLGMIPADGVQAAKKIRLNVNKIRMQVGGTKQLKVENAGQKVIWSSDKKTVAGVNHNGKVTALKAGKAVIRAKVGKRWLKCMVTVDQNHTDTGLKYENLQEKVLWTVDFNNGKQNAVMYEPAAGEWKRPLGLYSYAADEQNFFADDSVNGRILWYQKGTGVSHIALKRGTVCVGMSYDQRKNILYLLLFDNIAVEPQGVSCCKVELSKGLKVQETGMEAYGTIFDAAGRTVSGELYFETVQKILDQVKSVTGQKMDDVRQSCQVGDYRLYVCRDREHADSMRLLLERSGKIIAYTQLLYVGEFSGGMYQPAYMYQENGELIIHYIAQDQENTHSLQVIRPKLEACEGK